MIDQRPERARPRYYGANATSKSVGTLPDWVQQ
jgi:hypothetical protein